MHKANPIHNITHKYKVEEGLTIREEEAPGVRPLYFPNLSMWLAHTYDFCITIPTHLLHSQSRRGGPVERRTGGGGGMSSSEEDDSVEVEEDGDIDLPCAKSKREGVMSKKCTQ